ncbi:GPO family capsid scaffolding protein [Gallibacterium anatis]|uniref:GPO family capsid scaffolding protein n=1 Tax=Gallibacterium anatis TaxID=750 RepID=A0AAX3XGL6_9PAST|nr:GPO family capsid scaffolding protein [Gallibacterium anatis]MDK9430968.1 GPO family capsid scaffolding protein [Gallibacterium anatis]WIM80545.1 GPO family capsid scaffolding protein [Gallibacterium anatis]
MADKLELVTDFVCVATSGKTADGREISAADLHAMAKNYDPSVYTANIWLEHYRFLSNFGQVKELKATDEGGKTKLYARLAPNARLLELNREGVGLFTSIEITPDFADTNAAYLTGLAVTDSPASIGTTQLHFSKRIKDDVIVGQPEKLEATLFTKEEQQELSALKRFFTRFFNSNSENNNNKEEESMNEQQFAQLEQTITAAIAAGFSAIKSKPEVEQEKPEPANFATKTEKEEPAKFATEQQVAELTAKVEQLTEAFNKATQHAVTEVPQGEPTKTALNFAV